MIKSFKCIETAKIFCGQRSRKLPFEIQDRALRKLRQIHASCTLEDLKNPPGNMLEALRGNRSDQMSIHINQQWRICFVWKSGDAYSVEIVDDH